MVLALVSVGLLLYEIATHPSQPTLVFLHRLDTGIALVFLAEFFIKLSIARSSAEYFKKNWWLLLAAIPFSTPGTQALRLLRLLRLLRFSHGAMEMVAYLQRFVKKTHLLYLFIVWLIVLFGGALAFYVAEQGANPNVQTLFDGLWWAMATVTTIGYGDIYPVTVYGRLIAMVMMIAGVGTTGLFTAFVASFLVERKRG
jgi:voltage-gated potassium channel